MIGRRPSHSRRRGGASSPSLSPCACVSITLIKLSGSPSREHLGSHFEVRGAHQIGQGCEGMVPHVPTLFCSRGVVQMRFGMETGGRDASQQTDGVARWDCHMGWSPFFCEQTTGEWSASSRQPRKFRPQHHRLACLARSCVSCTTTEYRRRGIRGARPWLFNRSVVIPAFPINLPSPRQTSAPTSGAG